MWHDNNRSDPKIALKSVAYQLTTCIPGYETRLKPIESGWDTSALFRALFVDPMAGIQPSQPIVIAFDALDEATQLGRNDLADAIGASFGRTPPWLRFIISSRPHDSAINGPLQARTRGCWKRTARKTSTIYARTCFANCNRSLRPPGR